VIVRTGDRIALALYAIDYTPPLRINTVAWIVGVPAFEGIETITVSEAHSLVGLLPPQSAVASPEHPEGPPPVGVAAVVAALIAVAGLGVLARHRRGRHG
jgi:hypothetical protein